MAIQSTGTMANIESAISSQKHNIILPKEAGYMVGRTLIQQTKIQQTDAGSTQRKINQGLCIFTAQFLNFQTIAFKHIKGLSH